MDVSCEFYNYVVMTIDILKHCIKTQRPIQTIPYTTPNNIVHNLSNDISYHLDKQISFLHNGLNCSMFLNNYRPLSCMTCMSCLI